MNRLFLVSTLCGDFYVVSENCHIAECFVISMLNDADYGLSKNRVVKNISFLAKEVHNFGTKPYLSSGDNLFIRTNANTDS